MYCAPPCHTTIETRLYHILLSDILLLTGLHVSWAFMARNIQMSIYKYKWNVFFLLFFLYTIMLMIVCALTYSYLSIPMNTVSENALARTVAIRFKKHISFTFAMATNMSFRWIHNNWILHLQKVDSFGHFAQLLAEYRGLFRIRISKNVRADEKCVQEGDKNFKSCSLLIEINMELLLIWIWMSLEFDDLMDFMHLLFCVLCLHNVTWQHKRMSNICWVFSTWIETIIIQSELELVRL